MSLFLLAMEDKLKRLKEAGIDRILSNLELRRTFHEVAIRVFGQNCLNCDSKIREQYKQLIKLKSIKMNEAKYQLKEGAFISMSAPDWKEDLTTANLTDKKAEALLNRSLKYIKFFEVAPNIENLRKQADDGVKTLRAALGENPNKSEPTYFDELIVLKNIGPSAAKKLMDVYPTKDLLIDAIGQDEQMPFLGRFERGVQEGLKEL